MSTHWRLGSKVIDLNVPRIMAVANLTPDSFFSGSRVDRQPELQRSALMSLIEAGADIIDLGGQSTRPGSERVGAAEELSRVLPAIEELRRLSDSIPITVDTYYAEVARAALDAGADGVNDISAGRLDLKLLPLIAERGCGYVLMHMQGTPETMQQEPHYEDCAGEVRAFLAERLIELDRLGIDRDRVAVDPGIGFGKRPRDNVALLTETHRLADLGQPLLYGVSRKSIVGRLSGEEDAARRLAGTLGLTWELLSRGVMLHRVHDVAETRQLMNVWLGFRGSQAG